MWFCIPNRGFTFLGVTVSCTLRCYSFCKEFMFFTKVSLFRLLLVLEVCNVQLTFRKPCTANLLTMSNLTLDCSFKVKLGWVSIKVPKSHLLLVLEVSNVQSTFRKPYAVHLSVMSNLTLDSSFKVKLGQVSIKVLISLIIGVRSFKCTVNL